MKSLLLGTVVSICLVVAGSNLQIVSGSGCDSMPCGIARKKGNPGITRAEKETVKKPTLGELEKIEGEYICFGCTLKREKGAHAQCKIYGCDHALKLRDGTIWNFLENDKSKELIAGDFGDKKEKIVEVVVWGWKFPEAQYIDVDHYKLCLKGEKEKICENYVWCSVCRKMNLLDDGGGTVKYKGKTYTVCSPKCKGEFNKNPEKYIK